ncbi:HDOD domain-containing protein [Pseudomonas sp. SG20056]|uniref:HDOD domain-containing protein n=1 Tax=Pseudomonas sp. SG20056 TaxID=3074146 RepID=UPI00287FB9D4|nr:HDOD domain-containing protein [Pseudomonas sp. SG20056]WNF46617.1 HDOD domain-containing protein [Pseudomonas sp. SG20056]
MRVMILEDDGWIADLLKQIVLSLRPGSQVICLESVSAALREWQQRPADMLICDWNLPDGPGTRLLEQVRRDNGSTPLVVITGRSDRASVMAVRALKINAFISKPFQATHVAASLETLLPADNGEPPPQPADPHSDLLAYLHSLPSSALQLPLTAPVRDHLLQSFKGEQIDLRKLAGEWQHDPALTARLLAVANSSAYNQAGKPCTSLLEALHKLGAANSLNLALGLALRQCSALDNALLRLFAQAHLDSTEQLIERSTQLARECALNPAPFHTAALLHRMGELCVLYLTQQWQDSGQRFSEAQLMQALDQFSGPFAISIKAQWQLPMQLRELIGACYNLPANNVKRENILMRLAACELNSAPDDPELARLRRLAGLT